MTVVCQNILQMSQVAVLAMTMPSQSEMCKPKSSIAFRVGNDFVVQLDTKRLPAANIPVRLEPESNKAEMAAIVAMTDDKGKAKFSKVPDGGYRIATPIGAVLDQLDVSHTSQQKLVRFKMVEPPYYRIRSLNVLIKIPKWLADRSDATVHRVFKLQDGDRPSTPQLESTNESIKDPSLSAGLYLVEVWRNRFRSGEVLVQVDPHARKKLLRLRLDQTICGQLWAEGF